MGVVVYLAQNGKIKVQGHGRNNKVVEYVRANKPAIIKALSNKADLPPTCPLNNSGYCPPGCRFNNRLLIRMIKSGTLPDPIIGCPLLPVCGERK